MKKKCFNQQEMILRGIAKILSQNKFTDIHWDYPVLEGQELLRFTKGTRSFSMACRDTSVNDNMISLIERGSGQRGGQFVDLLRTVESDPTKMLKWLAKCMTTRAYKI